MLAIRAWALAIGEGPVEWGDYVGCWCDSGPVGFHRVAGKGASPDAQGTTGSTYCDPEDSCETENGVLSFHNFDLPYYTE